MTTETLENVEDKKVDAEYKNIAQEFSKSQSTNKTQTVSIPDNNFEMAQSLITNSETTLLMAEVDKEVKLANLNPREKQAVLMLTMVYQNMTWQKREQQKKELETNYRYKEFYTKYPQLRKDEDLIEEIEVLLDTNQGRSAVIFDKIGLLRLGLFIPTLSRGTFGFERTKQVETLQTQRTEYTDKTEQKPGFMSGLFGGGFKKGSNGGQN